MTTACEAQWIGKKSRFLYSLLLVVCTCGDRSARSRTEPRYRNLFSLTPFFIFAATETVASITILFQEVINVLVEVMCATAITVRCNQEVSDTSSPARIHETTPSVWSVEGFGTDIREEWNSGSLSPFFTTLLVQLLHAG